VNPDPLLDEPSPDSAWTTVNIGEALPGLFRPLSWTETCGSDTDGLELTGGGGELEETTLVKHLIDVSAGRRRLEGFIAEYGFHGPAEGDLASHPWREDAGPLHTWLRSLDARTSPDAQAERARRRERAGGLPRHVARELGVPCVIGTGDATARISTGDLLHVDGSTGTVTITRADAPGTDKLLRAM
jgi:hypothetical protein